MLRDHGKQFPKGIASLLELSSMARRAEPILLGPGNVLISLAKLIAAFLGKNLSKGSARTSNWAKPLKPIQVECESIPSHFDSLFRLRRGMR